MKITKAEEEDLLNKWRKFLSGMTPEKRKALHFTGKQGMCENGRAMFELYCDDPKNNVQFLLHFATRICGGCYRCHDTFIEHLRHVKI